MTSARGRLKRYALRLLILGVAAFLLLRLTPSLTHALNSLERVSWQWLLVVPALETLSELGYVLAWRPAGASAIGGIAEIGRAHV